MFTGGLIALCLILTAVAAIFYLEARLLLHAFLHRGQPQRPPFWTRLGAAGNRRANFAVHALAAFFLCCVPYAFLEPYWIETPTIRLSSPALPAAAGPVRLALLSDLHFDGHELNAEAAARLVNGLKPDFIAVAGDYLNSEAGIPAARRLLAALNAPHGVFCVNGNYDLAVPAPGLFDSLPVRRLDRSAAVLNIRGARLRLIGFDVGSGPWFRPMMKSLGTSPGFDVLLHHYSDLAYEAREAGIGLYLSGHTHGGQVRLPFYGALITLATFGKRFESGLYRVGEMPLYVSRGLGLEGGSAPRVRFLCRPEITLIEIHGTGK